MPPLARSLSSSSSTPAGDQEVPPFSLKYAVRGEDYDPDDPVPYVEPVFKEWEDRSVEKPRAFKLKTQIRRDEDGTCAKIVGLNHSVLLLWLQSFPFCLTPLAAFPSNTPRDAPPSLNLSPPRVSQRGSIGTNIYVKNWV